MNSEQAWQRHRWLLEVGCRVIVPAVIAAVAITLEEEDLPPLSTPKAIWTTDDESALIAFLLKHKDEARDGANFKSSVWKVAVEEMEKYTTKGGPKSADSCKLKWTQLKKTFDIVTTLKGLSGFTWDDTTGLSIGDNERSTWEVYCKDNPKAASFANTGFQHYTAMTALMTAFSPLDQSFGSSSAGSQAKSSLSNTSSFTRLPKRRLEAVDDNDTSSVSRKRRRISEHTIVLEKIMVEFGILVDQLRRDQILNRTSGQLARAPERLACDPERLARAHTQLEELRLLDLSPDALVAMHDLFNTDPAAVDIFLSIKGEDVRNKWVEQQVKLLGYIL